MAPFKNRVIALSGPARDALPITPNNDNDRPHVVIGRYVETGGRCVSITAHEAVLVP